MGESGWAGVDVGKEHHWVTLLDRDGAVLLSRKVANDEREIVQVIADCAAAARHVQWAIDLTTAEAALLLSVLWANEQPVRYLSGRSVNHAAQV
ncbi:MAG: hypothetical protein QOD41_4856, partial [Cryptosporangiaceae bacterium]|nr:hypothetical protein [Cryptosporangiaceae bacterium]